jgi:hypothetical protein
MKWICKRCVQNKHKAEELRMCSCNGLYIPVGAGALTPLGRVFGEEGTEADLPGEKREDGPLSFLDTDTEPWGVESVITF